MAALSRAGLSERRRQGHEITIWWFLGWCRRQRPELESGREAARRFYLAQVRERNPAEWHKAGGVRRFVGIWSGGKTPWTGVRRVVTFRGRRTEVTGQFCQRAGRKLGRSSEGPGRTRGRCGWCVRFGCGIYRIEPSRRTWCPAFTRSGPAKAGTPSRRFMEVTIW